MGEPSHHRRRLQSIESVLCVEGDKMKCRRDFEDHKPNSYDSDCQISSVDDFFTPVQRDVKERFSAARSRAVIPAKQL